MSNFRSPYRPCPPCPPCPRDHHRRPGGRPPYGPDRGFDRGFDRGSDRRNPYGPGPVIRPY